jgi:hypothetical protein
MIDVQSIVDAATGIVKLPPNSNSVFTRRWMSAFGAPPIVCCILWNKMDPFKTMPRGVEPKHLLWGLHFLAVYDTEENSSQRVGQVDEKTFRKWAHLFVKAISYLESEVVSFLDRINFLFYRAAY